MPNLLCGCFKPRNKSPERSSIDRSVSNRATASRGASFSRPLPARTPSSAQHPFSRDTFGSASFTRAQNEARARIEAQEAEQERQAAAQAATQAAARAAALAARQDPEAVAAARRLITGNMQLSANRPAVLREFEHLMRSSEEGTPEELAYQAMNNVMDTINGSDNAIREEHGYYMRR